MRIYDVTDKILLHLGLSDLKAANLVSKSWNAAVSEAYKTVAKTGSPTENVCFSYLMHTKIAHYY